MYGPIFPARGIRALSWISIGAFLACNELLGNDLDHARVSTDVPTGSDGGLDASTDSDAGGTEEVGTISGGAFCSTVVKTNLIWCDDFDGPSGLGAWQKLDVDMQSVYTIDDDNVSSPHAAHLEIAPGDGGSPDTRLQRRLPKLTAPYTHFAISGSVKVVRTGNKSALNFMNIQLSAARFPIRSDGTVREIPTGSTTGPDRFSPSPLPTNQWISFVVEFDLSKPSLSLTLGSETRTTVIDKQTPTDTPIVQIGPAEGERPTPGWIFLYDNLVVRVLD